MADSTTQSYANHTKMVPLYHYVTSVFLLVYFVWAVYRVVATGFSLDAVIGAGLGLGLIFLFFFARVFALGVQDRVIRLEERLRFLALLPDDLKTRVNDFSTEQLIALRFASDAELPELARKVLDENIRDRKTIKQMVKTWRPDLQRI